MPPSPEGKGIKIGPHYEQTSKNGSEYLYTICSQFTSYISKRIAIRNFFSCLCDSIHPFVKIPEKPQNICTHPSV